MVPLSREADVDTYFPMFEQAAIMLNWPRDAWPLAALSLLTLEQSLNYHTVKTAVLRAYELVPEAYWQNFGDIVKHSQTFVEFAREKENWFIAGVCSTGS